MNFVAPTIRKLGTIPGVAAGALLTAEIPARGTHYGIFLRATTAAGVELTAAEIKADMGNIIIRVNGQPKIELSATEALEMQKYYGDADVADNVAGIVPLFLYPRNLATWAEKSLFAYGMADVASMTIEINVVAVAKLAKLELFTFSTDENRKLGQHITWRRFPQSFAAASTQEVVSLLKDTPDIAYKAIHVKLGAGTLTHASCKVDGSLVYDQVPGSLNAVLNEDGKRKEQTGYYTISFDRNNDLSGILPMNNVKDFRQQLEWSVAPGTFDILAEIIQGLKS